MKKEKSARFRYMPHLEEDLHYTLGIPKFTCSPPNLAWPKIECLRLHEWIHDPAPVDTYAARLISAHSSLPQHV